MNDSDEEEEVATRNDQNRHQCDLCDYSSPKKIRVEEHKEKHYWNQPFRCPRCSFSAKRQSDTDNHLKKDHKNAAIPRKSLPKQPRAKKTRTRAIPAAQNEMETTAAKR